MEVISPCGESLVHTAVRNNQPAILELLVEKGAPVDRVNNYHQTPLDAALNDNQVEMAAFLLGHGAKIADDIRHVSSLVAFMSRGWDDMVSLFIEHGVGTSPTLYLGDNCHPIHRAFQLNKPKYVQALLTQNHSLANLANGRGDVPLTYAINSRSSKTVVVLLENGANPTSITNHGRTLLHTALRWHKWELIEPLLLAGAPHFRCDLQELTQVPLYDRNEVPFHPRCQGLEGCEVCINMCKWPRIPTLRTLILRVIYRNQVPWKGILPPKVLEYPDELLEKKYLDEIESTQQAYRKRKREESEELLLRVTRQK